MSGVVSVYDGLSEGVHVFIMQCEVPCFLAQLQKDALVPPFWRMLQGFFYLTNAPSGQWDQALKFPFTLPHGPPKFPLKGKLSTEGDLGGSMLI